METLSQEDHNSTMKKPIINPVCGIVDSLTYQKNGNNLVELKIQESNSFGIYTFTVDPDVDSDSTTIKIVNLNDFCLKLQEAFNNQFLVNIFHENDKILLLEIKRQVLIARGGGGSPGGPGSGGP